MGRKEKIKKLMGNEIWDIPSEELSRGYRYAVKTVKLIRLTLDTFARNRMGFQCVALSYFITLAIVPLCAVIFAITGGLRISDKIIPIINNLIPGQTDITSLIMEKAGNIIEIAKSGGVGIISALAFIWTIMWMMFQVERVFNNVWCIRKVPRKLYKRFVFYLLVLFLSPFIVLVFGSGIAMYANLPNLLGINVYELRVVQQIAGYLLFYIVLVFTFSVMYKYIPAAKVEYRNAIKAALLSGAVFVGFQYLYLETQLFVARLNTVYGVMAAIPLFLIWLNFSWQIIIYGAEFSYSLQNINNYKKCEED